MKRFLQFINEQEPFDKFIGNKYGARRLEGGADGAGGPSFKDLTGVNLPPDEIIAAGIAGVAGQKLNAAGFKPATGVQKSTEPSLSTKAATKVKDIAYDIVNKPHPLNPLTAKNIGKETGTAKYHAEKQFRKEVGRDPVPILRKDNAKLNDLRSSFLNRGYSRLGTRAPEEIGSNVGAPIPTKISSPQPIQKLKKFAKKESLKSVRQGSAEVAARVLGDTPEKRQEEDE